MFSDVCQARTNAAIFLDDDWYNFKPHLHKIYC